MKNILWGLVTFICTTVSAQNTPEVTRERVFVGKALYGFMNGGSDLYYEYGFEKLTAREVTYMGEEFTVDVYQMATPEDAFGIYSILVFKCLRADSLGSFDCQSKYQLQVVYGNEYISVVFSSGSAKAKKAADQLMRLYASKVESIPPSIPDQLSFVPKPYSGVLKLLKGPLAIANVYPELATYMKGIKNCSIWLVEKENRALFTFSSAEDRNLITDRVSVSKILQTGDQFLLLSLE